MSRPIKKRCLTCGNWFLPKSDINVFCKRSCFKKHYYHQKKAEELSAQKYPEFTCPKCGQHIRLDFDPAKQTYKWLKYNCPGCNTLMISVSEDIVTKDSVIT